MLIIKPARTILLMTVCGLAMLAPPLNSLARSKHEPVVIEAPPPPPNPPAGLSGRFLDDAAAYQAFVERVSGISPAFNNGTDVAVALRTSAAYEPHALTRGAIAYGAVAALASTTFVASVRALATSTDNRKIVLQYLLADPHYATTFAGSEDAAGLAKEALNSTATRLIATGGLVKASAYTIQKQAWSKGLVTDPSGRLVAIEQAGAGGLTPAPDHTATLSGAASGATPLPIVAATEKAPYGPLVQRALQLAAIGALGEATDENYDRLVTATPDSEAERCLHIVRLNLNQCLAVAKPHYEDVFCMGQHAMTDAGACLVTNATYTVPPPPPPPRPVVVEKPKAKATHRRTTHHRHK